MTNTHVSLVRLGLLTLSLGLGMGLQANAQNLSAYNTLATSLDKAA